MERIEFPNGIAASIEEDHLLTSGMIDGLRIEMYQRQHVVMNLARSVRKQTYPGNIKHFIINDAPAVILCIVYGHFLRCVTSSTTSLDPSLFFRPELGAPAFASGLHSDASPVPLLLFRQGSISREGASFRLQNRLGVLEEIESGRITSYTTENSEATIKDNSSA